jgi:predicted nucleotidyltransferase component of viral defense system
MEKSGMISVHEDEALFREAIRYTATKTGMSEILVEKDYFCSILLSYFQKAATPIVFKGGTSISKIYSDFYRMSEDLDFAISTRIDAKRSERSSKIAPFKDLISALPAKIPIFNLEQKLTGYNVSTQYIAHLSYNSILGNPNRIKVEVALREEMLTEPLIKSARTLIIDPFTGKPLVPEIEVMTMTFDEIYAEKFRAALTRREVAIRDFFDIYYAVSHSMLKYKAPGFIKLVSKKMKVPGNQPIDVSEQRKNELKVQSASQLRPVLRQADYEMFDLDEAFDIVQSMARFLEKKLI